MFKDYDTFSLEGQNVIFYHSFITGCFLVFMIITTITVNKAFQYAAFYIIPTGLIAFFYYNPRSTKISEYIRQNYPALYKELGNRSKKFTLSGLIIISPAWIPEAVVESIPDPEMKIMIKEMVCYRKLLKYSFIAFILFYFFLGIITGLQINKGAV
jgi:hypothetical protein